MLTVAPRHLPGELSSTSAALLAIVGTIRRELARPQSVLHTCPIPVQALLLSARHCIADLDRLAATLDNEDRM